MRWTGTLGTIQRVSPSKILRMVNASAIGLMAAVTIQLASSLSGRPRLWPAAIVAAAIGLAGRSAAWMLLAAVLLTMLVNFSLL